MNLSRSQLLNWLRVGIGLALFALLFNWVPVDRLLGSLSNARLAPLTGAFVVTCLCFLISAIKIHLTLSVLDQSLALSRVWKAYYVGTFFNNFIPTSIGGDLVKTYELSKGDDTHIATNTLAVVVERLSGILVLGVIGAAYLFQRPDWYETVGLSFARTGREWVIYALLLAGVVLLLTYVFRENSESPEETTNFTSLREWVRFPTNHPTLTVGLIGLSVLFHLLRVLVFWLAGLSLGVTIPWSVILFVLPIIAFASFLPISMGGIGLREGIITFCLHAFGLPIDVSFGISLVIRAFSLLHSTAGGVVYLTNSSS